MSIRIELIRKLILASDFNLLHVKPFLSDAE